MLALSGIGTGQPAFPGVWSASKANAGTSPANLNNDQASDQAAQASVADATQQLSSDQQPRGTPSAIAADEQAVKIAQQDAAKAADKLKADQAQGAGLDVLA